MQICTRKPIAIRLKSSQKDKHRYIRPHSTSLPYHINSLHIPFLNQKKISRLFRKYQYVNWQCNTRVGLLRRTGYIGLCFKDSYTGNLFLFEGLEEYTGITQDAKKTSLSFHENSSEVSVIYYVPGLKDVIRQTLNDVIVESIRCQFESTVNVSF